MKYSILGFNQYVVLKYRKFVNRKVRGIEKEVEVRIDVTDLLLINALSDFMNRPNIIKSEVEGKNYFWVNYSTLLEDLPILDISKQALSDRLDKLSDFNIIEKKVVLNSMGTFTCFRMGKEYENIKYSSDRQCSNDDTGSYSTTRGGRSQLLGGVVVNYDPNMNTLNNEYAKREEKEDTNVSSKDDENWRTSFAIYKSLVDEAKLRLINDRDYQAYIESYYPNSDYVKTINKMVEGFWGIEDGWEHCKKKRKAKNINMYAAMKKNLDNRNRIVYNSISTFPSKKTYNPNNEDNKPSVPLHPELTYVDNDGTLNDGTFMKNGYRYYFSNKQGESFSVPPGEEPKPSGDNWEYAYGTGWYENIE